MFMLTYTSAFQGSLWAIAAMTIWIMAPLATGLRQFARKDF